MTCGYMFRPTNSLNILDICIHVHIYGKHLQSTTVTVAYDWQEQQNCFLIDSKSAYTEHNNDD